MLSSMPRTVLKMSVKADAVLEEGLDGDFIGGVEDDGRAVVGGQRIVGGLKKRKGLRVGLLEGQPADFGKAQALRAAVKPFGPAEGVGDRRAHVSRAQLRDDRAVLELDRRVHDALRVDHDLDALGSKSKSQRASITSRPLFMRLAESTLILRPMDHFG